MLAAQITTGVFGEPANVVFVSSEDSLEIDLLPRLVAAGADVSKVKFITDTFKLPDDIGRLRATVESIGNVALIVVDPLSNHIGRSDSNSEAEVRNAIAGLNELADVLDCVIIGVRHPSKDRSRGALASVLGSTAWVDTPRAVVMIAVDDEDETVRHVQVVAGNRSATTGGIMFRIEGVLLDGLKEEVTRAVPLGASMKDIDDLLNPEKPASGVSKSARARELVLDKLEAAPNMEMLSDALDAQVAQEVGLEAKTVRHVRASLKGAGLIGYRCEPVPEHPNKNTWFVYRTAAARP
jgi:hypothetical protein